MTTPPTFTTGQVLTAAQMNTIGMFLVKSQAVGTGVTQVAVTDAFSADYDNYKIIYSGGTQSGAVNLNLSLGASLTNYNTVLLYTTSASAVPQTAGVNLGSSFNWVGGGAAGQASHLECELFSPYLSIYTKMRNGAYQNDNFYGTCNGEHRVASSYTGFTIYAAAGTLTGGTIRVYGFRN